MTEVVIFDGLRDILAQFQIAYLARSWSKLFYLISEISSGSKVKQQSNSEEVSTMIIVIISEMSIASVDKRLMTFSLETSQRP